MTSPLLPSRRIALVALSALLLAGCATPSATRYPSLLPRAIETRSDALPEATVTPAVAEPATDSALATLRKTLDTTVAGFNPAATAADRVATTAHGDAVGSERWIAAQTALGELDGYHATLSSTLTDIDALALARAADGKPDYPAITALRSAAQSAFDEQTARIAAITAKLRGA